MSDSGRLAQIIERGESQTLEFKKSLRLANDGLQSLCGMVNSDQGQGQILFGVSPDGALVGVEPGNPDKAQLSLLQKIQSKFDPQLVVNIELLHASGRAFLLLIAQRDSRTPFHEYDGRAFIREGSATRQLSLSEKQSLFRRRSRDQHTGPWKCDKCGSYAGVLSIMVVTDEGISKSYACHCGGEYWPAA
jgi:predicted HTH transcriptional regulator